MRSASETEMEIVFLQLQRIRKLDVLKRPASVVVLEIFRTILNPYANIAFRLLAYLVRIHVAAVEDSGFPLNAGETANPREHAAELVRHEPCRIKRADSARRLS